MADDAEEHLFSVQLQDITPDLIEELKPMFPIHWEELGLYRDRMPLDPQYEEYLRRSAAGQTICVTLRDRGALAGYFVGFIAPGLHYRQTLTCTMDIVWIRPDLRGTGAGLQLFAAVKAALIKRGVQLWHVGSKNSKPIEGFFKLLGFEPSDQYLSMWIGV